MPQMAPMSWMLLYLFFSLSLTAFYILNYFSFNSQQMTSNNYPKMNNKTPLIWKW